jgi:hypothetical protein
MKLLNFFSVCLRKEIARFACLHAVVVDLTDGSLVYKRCCPGKGFTTPYWIDTFSGSPLSLIYLHSITSMVQILQRFFCTLVIPGSTARNLTQMITLILICLWLLLPACFSVQPAFYLRTLHTSRRSTYISNY